MAERLMSREEIDRAYPEKWPRIFIFGHCGACRKCYLDLRVMQCDCKGPFNARLEFDPSAFVPFQPS